MLRIVVGSWMVRYPLGGNLSWTLQWLLGFHRLGHEVYLAEKAGWHDSCYDPIAGTMTDQPVYGLRTVSELLAAHGLGDRWCYVDEGGHYHGLGRRRIEQAFATADVFLDLGTHGTWLEEAEGAGTRVLVDGEPGFTQMKMEQRAAATDGLPAYDRYFTNGHNIGRRESPAPTAGRDWHGVFNPVVCDLFDPTEPPPAGAPYTTVMHWQSHEPLAYGGRMYGQKDVEFRRFIGLPAFTGTRLEIAAAGNGAVPKQELERLGWALADPRRAALSFDGFRRYVLSSRGEFAVCKNVFVATNAGWFSDRSAVYLASGRPVVMQDTGFGGHLPCGRGLFAVASAEEAAAALEEIEIDWSTHSRAARDIAVEHLDTSRVLPAFLDEIGVR